MNTFYDSSISKVFHEFNPDEGEDIFTGDELAKEAIILLKYKHGKLSLQEATYLLKFDTSLYFKK